MNKKQDTIIKKLNKKTIEVLTKKHDLYIHKEKNGFILDIFSSKQLSANDSFIGSSLLESEDLETELNSYNLNTNEIKNIFQILKV